MAGVEPYSPCPCGSGQKFKWCCHKVEPFAEKAQRLFDGGQAEAAIKVLDDGLRKEAGNPWLLTRKAIMQIRQGEPELAKTTLRQVLQKAPKHLGALILLTRCVMETEGPVNGAGTFQQVLSAVDDAARRTLAGLARLVGLLLAEYQLIPAALKHMELFGQLEGTDKAVNSARAPIEGNTAHAPWLKDRLELAEPPAHLEADARRRFDEALALAARGLWAPAAGAFDWLSTQQPGGEADYNLGLCRLWLGDEPGAVGPLRRRARQLGDSTRAVDLEALCQLIEPTHPEDRVEHVELTWPLRNREALLASLRSHADIFDDGLSPVDPDDPDSPEVDEYALLDRPVIDKHTGVGLSAGDIPRILGRILVGQDAVALNTHDDGRVDSLGDRFTALAGSSIAPAHPRTKVLGEEARSSLALVWEWLYPAGMDLNEARRLDREQQVRMLQEVWPVTPMPYLGFRTPERASKDRDAAIPLRAALRQFEQNQDLERVGLDFAAFRARFHLEPEPAIDPATVDLEQLPLARLAAVPADRLDDDRLLMLYRRARRTSILGAMEAAARVIVDRPNLFDGRPDESVAVYTDLASVAATRGDKDESFSWIARGRQADPPGRQGPNAPVWDMIEIRLLTRFERPEVWVPELAVVLERYNQQAWANQTILFSLIEMGLVRLTPNPDNPDDVLLDTRPLQALMAEFGPRVTTSTGRLGVSATKPELWTPGGPASTSGNALWTPGSGSGTQPTGDKPKLIIPGR